jgi:DNA polymerase III delta prime subunit
MQERILQCLIIKKEVPHFVLQGRQGQHELIRSVFQTKEQKFLILEATKDVDYGCSAFQNRIKLFVEQGCCSDKHKLVIIHVCDALTPDFQVFIRPLMNHSVTCTFVFCVCACSTSLLHPGILSRCIIIDTGVKNIGVVTADGKKEPEGKEEDKKGESNTSAVIVNKETGAAAALWKEASKTTFKFLNIMTLAETMVAESVAMIPLLEQILTLAMTKLSSKTANNKLCTFLELLGNTEEYITTHPSLSTAIQITNVARGIHVLVN